MQPNSNDSYGLNTPDSGYGYGRGPYTAPVMNTMPVPASGYGMALPFGDSADVYDGISGYSELERAQLLYNNGGMDDLSGFSIGGLIKGIGNAIGGVVKSLPIVGQVVSAAEAIIKGGGKTTVTTTPTVAVQQPAPITQQPIYNSGYYTGSDPAAYAAQQALYGTNLNAPLSQTSTMMWIMAAGLGYMLLSRRD